MASQDDFGIVRDDVPYLSRDWSLRIQTAVSLLLWVYAWWQSPYFRPGIIEIFIGVVFALPVGFFYARPAIAQARAAAARSRMEAGPAIFPFCPDAGVVEYFTAVIVAFFACLLLVAVIFLFYLSLKGMEMPWAHFGADVRDFPYQSVLSSSTVYFVVNVNVVWWRLYNWYRSLPVKS